MIQQVVSFERYGERRCGYISGESTNDRVEVTHWLQIDENRYWWTTENIAIAKLTFEPGMCVPVDKPNAFDRARWQDDGSYQEAFDQRMERLEYWLNGY